MIVKLELIAADGGNITMLFGDSYKSWQTQFNEYSYTFKPKNLITAETSKEKWISWGGLKWCNDSNFQKELNREGCQDNDPDNPKPRQYENMKFVKNQIVENIANKRIRQIAEWEKQKEQC